IARKEKDNVIMPSDVEPYSLRGLRSKPLCQPVQAIEGSRFCRFILRRMPLRFGSHEGYGHPNPYKPLFSDWHINGQSRPEDLMLLDYRSHLLPFPVPGHTLFPGIVRHRTPLFIRFYSSTSSS